jgi:hypothetical protein
MKTVLLFVSLIFTSLSTFAHLGKLTGTVYDQATNLPLRGVNVRLTGPGRATLTDELGHYRFEGLTPASYTVELSHVGFGAQTVVALVQDDQTTVVNTVLGSAPVQLSEVLVSSQRAHDQQLISSLDINSGDYQFAGNPANGAGPVHRAARGGRQIGADFSAWV